ncbi:MAG TPA: dienelactone hydrolase family protein, partial [Sphingomonadales bacterium]|nr:dienelactone hydrolase family protein [Sphingomonadales bacterium]
GRAAMAGPLTVQTPDGSFSGYLALPKAGKGPGLVIAQEIFGVNRVMRKVADAFVAQGFAAFVPDLFWRFRPGIELGYSDADWKKAGAYYQAFDVDKGVEDLQAAITALRKHPAVTGKVGVVGYCLGGLLAYLCACRTESDATVGFYGVGIESKLGETKNIKKPTLLHFAENDKFVPLAAIQKIEAALKGNAFAVIHRYPGVDHAFARVGEAHYRAEAAELANRRTFEFLKRNLF